MSLETITLGGGCFWCLEAVFQRLKGVTHVESGYANGHVEHPAYEDVCSGATGHAEVVKVQFDPAVISYRRLLEIFMQSHDPTTLNRQGADVGTQYRSGIYTEGRAQQAEAPRLGVKHVARKHGKQCHDAAEQHGLRERPCVVPVRVGLRAVAEHGLDELMPVAFALDLLNFHALDILADKARLRDVRLSEPVTSVVRRTGAGAVVHIEIEWPAVQVVLADELRLIGLVDGALERDAFGECGFSDSVAEFVGRALRPTCRG